MIPKEKLAELAKLLKQDGDRIEKELEVLKNDEFGDTPGLDNEEADEVEEMSNTLATVQVLERRLLDIKDALARITAGTYGSCIRCHKEISLELLKADPESGLCKDCKAA
jgi:RNA polymerase-binding transcription factor DksA